MKTNDFRNKREILSPSFIKINCDTANSEQPNARNRKSLKN